MKHHIFFLICMTGTQPLYGISQRKCDLILQPLWQEIQASTERAITFNGKWMRAGTITFRKKIMGPLELNAIVLNWHGPPIKSLEASLYCTEINKPFLAIDSNWVGDGQWSNQSQRLTFKFKSPCALCSVTTFHLMLTVPESLEAILKQGNFTLSPCTLPEEYKDIQEEARKLSFCIPTSSVLG